MSGTECKIPSGCLSSNLQGFDGKPDGKGKNGKPRRIREDNINTLRTGDANLRF